jgi:hypothetical protein
VITVRSCADLLRYPGVKSNPAQQTLIIPAATGQTDWFAAVTVFLWESGGVWYCELSSVVLPGRARFVREETMLLLRTVTELQVRQAFRRAKPLVLHVFAPVGVRRGSKQVK